MIGRLATHIRREYNRSDAFEDEEIVKEIRVLEEQAVDGVSSEVYRAPVYY
jgi:hypothetical protein